MILRVICLFIRDIAAFIWSLVTQKHHNGILIKTFKNYNKSKMNQVIVL